MIADHTTFITSVCLTLISSPKLFHKKVTFAVVETVYFSNMNMMMIMAVVVVVMVLAVVVVMMTMSKCTLRNCEN